MSRRFKRPVLESMVMTTTSSAHRCTRRVGIFANMRNRISGRKLRIRTEQTVHHQGDHPLWGEHSPGYTPLELELKRRQDSLSVFLKDFAQQILKIQVIRVLCIALLAFTAMTECLKTYHQYKAIRHDRIFQRNVHPKCALGRFPSDLKFQTFNFIGGFCCAKFGFLL